MRSKVITSGLLGAFLGGGIIFPLLTAWLYPTTDTSRDNVINVVGTGIIVGFAVCAYLSYLKQSNIQFKEQDAHQKWEREQANARAQRDQVARTAREASTRQLVVSSAQEAERIFRNLPVQLTEAATQVEHARSHKQAGAYSPFWAAIEIASVTLGDYNANVRRLGTLAGDYPQHVRAYRTFGSHGGVPDFPVSMTAAKATDAAEPVAAAVRILAYDAQRDPVYAQIWEQRRTTSAVVQGFRSLEVAIDLMARTVEVSVGALTSRVVEVGERTSSSGKAVTAAVRDASQVQAASNVRLQSALDDAVWHLDDQRKRALGWR